MVDWIQVGESARLCFSVLFLFSFLLDQLVGCSHSLKQEKNKKEAQVWRGWSLQESSGLEEETGVVVGMSHVTGAIGIY